jgi:hypothetical protein
MDRGPLIVAMAETIGLGPQAWHAGKSHVSRSYRVAHHIEMPGVANYVTVGEHIPPSNGVAGLEAELGQWNDGI